MNPVHTHGGLTSRCSRRAFCRSAPCALRSLALRDEPPGAERRRVRATIHSVPSSHALKGSPVRLHDRREMPMIAGKFVRPSAVLAAALFVAPVATAQITVGKAAQVSASHPGAAHTEYFIDADPAHRERLAVCSMAIDPARNRITSVLYTSRDTGATWRMALNDSISRFGESMDPACAFGPGGVVVFASLPNQMDPTQPDIPSVTRVRRSLDGGRTWSEPNHIRYLDNEDFAVDRTEGPYKGRIYVVGTRAIPNGGGKRNMAWLYSADSGLSFTGPITTDPLPGTTQGGVSAPVVLEDGTMLVPAIVRRATAKPDSIHPATDSIPEVAVVVVAVHEGGTRADPPVRVAPIAQCPGASGPPTAAQDRTGGPFRNRIYVTFGDAANGRCQIMLSWSDDGKKWSKPLPVDDPAIPAEEGKGPDAFFPEVAVNYKGVVGLTWYDRREDPKNRVFRLRFTASADGGNSVMPSVAVSTHAHVYAADTARERYFALGLSFRDREGSTWIGVATGQAFRTLNSVGDYGGFVARPDGAFQAVWVDNRTGVPQLFTAPVRVSATVETPAARDARLGRRVSDSVSVRLSSSVFDPTTCTMQIGIVLLNETGRQVRSPLVFRVDHVLSQIGTARFVGEKTDDLGRPVMRIAPSGGPNGAMTSHQARVAFDGCRMLPLSAEESHRHRLDARLVGTPPSGLVGPKLLILHGEVFEPPAGA